MEKRILTVQDISCLGQCSMTVALPILSACGLETCILPSSVLSTHTGGFTGYTVRDLTDDFPGICAHWQSLGIRFDAVYTGYLGSVKQIGYVKEIMDTLLTENGLRIVDPAMADNGKLYWGFDDAYVKAMAGLCRGADVLLPNITEAAFLTDMPYKEQYDEAYIGELLKKCGALGAKKVVLTGVCYKESELGIAVYDTAADQTEIYFHKRIPGGIHGTGDVYSSIFAGALLRGFDAFEAAKLAGDLTLRSIEITKPSPDHWYGVYFEKVLPDLIRALDGAAK